VDRGKAAERAAELGVERGNLPPLAQRLVGSEGLLEVVDPVVDAQAGDVARLAQALEQRGALGPRRRLVLPDLERGPQSATASSQARSRPA
jgi:hypothetical protein